MQTSNQNQWYGAGKFDPINSTFKAIIYFPNGKQCIGYSKGLHAKEGHDKTVVLEKWIIRLANKGYFNEDRIIRMEFYLKSFLDRNDELIFTLYPTKYIMGSNDKYSLNERLITFLNRFYTALDERKMDLTKVVHKAKRLDESKVFDLSHKWLKDEMELMTFILKKQREGFENGQLLGFADAYRKKFLPTHY